MTGPVLLEICVDTADGLDIAATCGADRIELCASLGIGGLTPSLGMMRLAAELDCPTRVMIRPRQGDFTYSAAELAMMRHDIDAVADIGLEGVVLGANLENGELDAAALAELTAYAKAAGLKVTLHRSFDLVPDPLAALALARSLGINSILTSGCAMSAIEGTEVIARLVQAVRSEPGNPIEIMAGVGVSYRTVGEILRRTGVPAVHGSCSLVDTQATGDTVRFGFAVQGHRRTDVTLVTQLRQALSQDADNTVGAR
ncbi:MAG: copper homeostasis protein CutC [Asticcacaulis sp.]|nr:copper homeostasis protein CutC [Asticcacaulis sp.]